MITVILALDLGATAGWALRGGDGHITSGSERFRPQRFEGDGMHFLYFKRWLSEIKQSCDGIDYLHFEEVYHHVLADATYTYSGFPAALTAWCEHHQVPYQGVPVGTIKKHITGRGNAGKEDIIASVIMRGHAPVDDDEADVLALPHWVIQHHDDDQEVRSEGSHTPVPLSPRATATPGHRSGHHQETWPTGSAHPDGQRTR